MTPSLIVSSSEESVLFQCSRISVSEFSLSFLSLNDILEQICSPLNGNLLPDNLCISQNVPYRSFPCLKRLFKNDFAAFIKVFLEVFSYKTPSNTHF